MAIRNVFTCRCLVMLGNMLLSGTESGHIQVWDLDKAQLIHQVAAHTRKYSFDPVIQRVAYFEYENRRPRITQGGRAAV